MGASFHRSNALAGRLFRRITPPLKREDGMRIVLLALLLSACVSVEAHVTNPHVRARAAIESARVRECPASRVQADARSEGFGESRGVLSQDVALTPLASDPTRAVRLRRITVQPG